MKRQLESPEQAAARLGSPAMTAGERAQVWDRIQATHEGANPRRSRVVVWGVGAAAAVAAIVLVLGSTIGRRGDERPTALCRLDPAERTFELPANCEAHPVRVGQDEWLLMPGARVSRVDEGARVEVGKVEFRVHKRSRADFRVHVIAGHQVRVIGTVFKIEQEGSSGSVSVTEGVIEFIWNDGVRERVAVGQTLFWPRRTAAHASAAAEPRASPTQAPPAKSSSPAPAEAAPSSSAAPKSSAGNLESTMDRVLQLKSQRRYGELIALLQKTQSLRDTSPVQRQRLSYELGLALDAAGQSSCAHWKRHARSYGAGPQGGALATKLERCKP